MENGNIESLKKALSDYDAAKDFNSAMMTRADEFLSTIVMDVDLGNDERKEALSLTESECKDLICAAFSKGEDSDSAKLELAKADSLITAYEVICSMSPDGAAACRSRHVDIVESAIDSLPGGKDAMAELLNADEESGTVAARLSFLTSARSLGISFPNAFVYVKDINDRVSAMADKLASDLIRESKQADEDSDDEQVSDLKGYDYENAIKEEYADLSELATASYGFGAGKAWDEKESCPTISSAQSSISSKILKKYTQKLAASQAESDVFGSAKGKEKLAQLKSDIAVAESIFGKDAVDPLARPNKADYDSAYKDAKELRESVKEDEERSKRQAASAPTDKPNQRPEENLMDDPIFGARPQSHQPTPSASKTDENGVPIPDSATQRFHEFLKNRK
jgi:hypothetical protein